MANGSTWQRVAAIAPLITALTVLTVAVIGGVGWVNNYFAKERQVENRLCILRTRAELLDLRMQASNLYSIYLNTKIDIAELSQSDIVADREKLLRLEGEGKVLLKDVQQKEQGAKIVSERLRDIPCEKWEDAP